MDEGGLSGDQEDVDEERDFREPKNEHRNVDERPGQDHVHQVQPRPCVPLALWSLDGPGRAETLGAAILQTLAVGAVLALLSVPFSLALLLIWIGNLASGLRRQ